MNHAINTPGYRFQGFFTGLVQWLVTDLGNSTFMMVVINWFCSLSPSLLLPSSHTRLLPVMFIPHLMENFWPRKRSLLLKTQKCPAKTNVFIVWLQMRGLPFEAWSFWFGAKTFLLLPKVSSKNSRFFRHRHLFLHRREKVTNLIAHPKQFHTKVLFL